MKTSRRTTVGGYAAVVPDDGSQWFPLLSRQTGGAAPVDRAVNPKDIGAATVDCGLYDQGRRQGERIELETALERADACTDGFVWIGLHDPSPEVIEAVGGHFKCIRWRWRTLSTPTSGPS